MIENQISFYYVDSKYVNYLKTIDNKVPNMVYDSNRKFVCGVVLKIHNHKYYAPVSSHDKKMRTSFRIKNLKTDEIISSVRLSYMFPVPDQLLTKVDTKEIRTKDPAYASLLVKELAYCNTNKDKLLTKAAKVYNDVVKKRIPFACNCCCNFSKLEKACDDYLNADVPATLDSKP